MSVVEMKSLLEAGVHFGHQTHRWNPKMKKYIFIKRDGIHIIDLKQTLEAINQAYYFLRELTSQKKHVLFVGTKKQASEGIENAAKKCDEYYVNHRWYGGTLTNMQTIRKSIAKLDEFERLKETGEVNKYTKLEVLKMQRKYDKILNALGGIRNMEKLPDVVVIADTVDEINAVKEAKKLKIPIVAIVDTNSDPEGIDYPIPGNDDAMKSVNLLMDILANAILEGKKIAEEGGEIKEEMEEEEEKIETEKEEVKEEKKEEIAAKVKEKEEIKAETIKKVTPKEKKKEVEEKPKKDEEKLKAEKEKKSKPVKKERYKCEYCDKTFASKRGLKIHLGLVHQK